jgi:hypothetical protein
MIWLPAVLWWLNWGLVVAGGQFPGVPWLAAVAVIALFIGTRAVFRYRKLTREDTRLQLRTAEHSR